MSIGAKKLMRTHALPPRIMMKNCANAMKRNEKTFVC